MSGRGVVDHHETERLEHRALDRRPWREWGHSPACEDCRWERMKEERVREFAAKCGHARCFAWPVCQFRRA